MSLSEHDKAVLNRVFNPEMPLEDCLVEEGGSGMTESDCLSETESEARLLEVEGVKAAEIGDIISALDKFTAAINTCPSRASGYNNRAQALRLKGDNEGAREDLDKAIEISEGNGMAAAQAYVQRALLKKRQGDADAALEDFKKAANLGSPFAKNIIVQMNPYAAMCNAMLAEMFHKVKTGEL